MISLFNGSVKGVHINMYDFPNDRKTVHILTDVFLKVLLSIYQQHAELLKNWKPEKDRNLIL